MKTVWMVVVAASQPVDVAAVGHEKVGQDVFSRGGCLVVGVFWVGPV